MRREARQPSASEADVARQTTAQIVHTGPGDGSVAAAVDGEGLQPIENPDAGSLSHETVLRIAREIRAHARRNPGLGEDNRREHFFERYPAFAKGYPVLFMAVTRNDFDIRQLERILNVVRDSDGDKAKADGDVGDMLFARYVKPVFE